MEETHKHEAAPQPVRSAKIRIIAKDMTVQVFVDDVDVTTGLGKYSITQHGGELPEVVLVYYPDEIECEADDTDLITETEREEALVPED